MFDRARPRTVGPPRPRPEDQTAQGFNAATASSGRQAIPPEKMEAYRKAIARTGAYAVMLGQMIATTAVRLAMSSGRLFLDRVARQHCPSPLHRHTQINMHSVEAQGKGDISTLPRRGHFYFAYSDSFLLHSIIFWNIILTSGTGSTTVHPVSAREALSRLDTH